MIFRVLLLCLIASTGAAQEWIDAYGHNGSGSSRGQDVLVDAQGNVYSCGGSCVTGARITPCIIRYAATGEHLWTRLFNITQWIEPTRSCLAVTNSGLIVTGGLGIGASVYLAACNQNGDSVWAETLRMTYQVSSEYFDMTADRKGFIYVTATAYGDSTGDNIFTAKVREDGQVMWRSYYDGQRHGSDVAEGIAVDTAGNVYVAGQTVNALAKTKPVLLKYNPSGGLEWVRTYGLEGNSNGGYCDVVVTPDGCVCAAGIDGWTQTAPVGKYTASGDSVWNVAPPGSVARLTTDAAGNLFATGCTPDSGTAGLGTRMLTPAGTVEWSKTYHGPDRLYDEGTCIALDHQGNVLVAGNSDRSPHWWPDFATVKYSATGQLLWSARYYYYTTEYARSLACDAQNNVYVTGDGLDSTGETRTVWITLKYGPNGPGVEEPLLTNPNRPVLTCAPSVVRHRCSFSAPTTVSLLELRIADVNGRMVRGIPVPAGGAGDRVSVTWDTRDEHGQLVPNGVYFVTLASASARSSCKVIVQRK